MSIIDSLDDKSEAIINPRDVIAPIEGFPKVAVATFQTKAHAVMLRLMGDARICELTAGGVVPIYKGNYGGRDFAFYCSCTGGSTACELLEELIACGARKVLFYGSCGSLDKAISAGHYIVPTHAYRDEGVSYHYAPPGDYIEIKTADRLAAMMDELGVPCVKARTWTTDAVYRETRRNMEARRAEGCAAVEMECASVMAVGQFRNIEVYQFLYAADCLDGASWDRRILGNQPQEMRERHVRIALELAARL